MENERRTPGLAAAVPAIGVAVMVLMLGAAPCSGAEIILQNDGFVPPGELVCIPGFDVGEIGAARFEATPQDYPFTLERIQVIICPDGPAANLVVKVWQDDGSSVAPGDLLHEDIYTLTPSSVYFNEIDISDQNIVVASGWVRVGIEFFFFPSPPGLARDMDGITGGVNFVYALPGIWYYSEQLGVEGDWIIRLVVDSSSPMPFVDGFESGDTSAWSSTVP
jgi:hypothetical protein